MNCMCARVCVCVCVLRRVRLSATPWTVALQAPLSMGFLGQNPGVGCHFLQSSRFLPERDQDRAPSRLPHRWVSAQSRGRGQQIKGDVKRAGEVGVGAERVASTQALDVRTSTGGLVPVRGETPVGSMLFSAGSRVWVCRGGGGGWKRCTFNVKAKESDTITCRCKNTGLFHRNRWGGYG